jgi:hypothetical protein
LLKLFSFYSLRSIRLEFSKCLISFNFPKYSMPYLFKPHLKTKLKQFFKGVAHEQHWSSKLYVCCGGPLLCPVFFEVIYFQNPFLLSFSFPLLKLFFFTFLSPFFWNSQNV